MMKLTCSPASPFVRKVRIAAAIKGVAGSIQCVSEESDAAAYRHVRGHNPLSKMPTLLLDDGRALHDSHVICEFLDTLRPQPRLFPTEPGARIETLQLAALADGILEAAVLIVVERRFRPEDKWVQAWIDRQQGKVDAALSWLKGSPPSRGPTPDYGHLTLACALGYLDFRQQGAWRAANPGLVAWLDWLAGAVPAFAQTAPPSG